MFHQERLIAELALTVILYYISLIDNMLAWLSINPFKPQVLSLFLWFFLFHYIRFAVIKSDINHYNKCMQGSNYMTTTTRCTHSLVTLFGVGDFGPYWQDAITQSLQIYQLQSHEVILLFHHIPQVPCWTVQAVWTPWAHCHVQEICLKWFKVCDMVQYAAGNN